MKRQRVLAALVAVIVGPIAFGLRRNETPGVAHREAPPPTVVVTRMPLAALVPISVTTDNWEVELAAHARALTPLAQTRRLTADEIHDTPTSILESGRHLGEVWEKAHARPERRQAALKFYLRCAEDAQLPVPVRATCWRKLNDGASAWREFVPFADADVPEDVRGLALEL